MFYSNLDTQELFCLMLILCSELWRSMPFVNLCLSYVCVECRCQSINTDKRKSNRNLLDNASNLLTDLLSGGSIGSMPVAEGAVSHLFGRPLFFSLYMIGSWRYLHFSQSWTCCAPLYISFIYDFFIGKY